MGKYYYNVPLNEELRDIVKAYANDRTNGNTVAMIALMLDDWVKSFESLSPSLEIQLAAYRYKAIERKRDIKKLQQDYLYLLKNPDSDHEWLCQERAKELNTPWPPQDVKAWEVEKELVNALSAVKVETNGNGTASIRSVYRRLNITRDECNTILLELAKYGQVDIDWIENEVKLTTL